MSNNRDKEFGEHEETEYHFTDDDVTYEAEPEETIEVTKPEPVTKKSSNFLADFGTRRIILSGIAFLFLLFIVYKIVAPSSDRNTIAPIANNTDTNTQASAPTTTTTTTSTTTTATSNTAPTNAAPGNNMAPAQQQPMSPPPQTGTSAQQSYTATTVTPSQPSNVPPTMQQETMTQTNQMPAVMPVTSPPPTYPASSPAVESGSNQLNSINNQLVAQIQQDYNQKLAEVNQQNKQLENDIQRLNATVTSIEAKMNQLVQLMVRQQAESQQKAEENPVQTSSQGPKLPYTVQAIIPGRAWLRANNGDTITVTEGDTIKDAGKVTKIDPYDGIIEINTGHKTVSLSYGNGG